MHDSRRYSFADEIRTNNFPSGKKANIDEEKAMELFYNSNTYMLMSKGISDFHCLSDAYLVEEIMLEQNQ